MQLSILAVEYLEPYYAETKKCIAATGLPVTYVKRNPEGIGSLAEAINRGMKQMTSDYVWIVTNVTFKPDTAHKLLKHIGDADVIHPSFNSDHLFMREGNGQRQVPFVEFTAAMVKRSSWMGLDETMPYWGHDIDYGLRCTGKILVDYETRVDHVYIRNSKPHPITQRRLRLRRLEDAKTKARLLMKHGKDWKQRTSFKADTVTAIYANIMREKCKLIVIDCDGVLTDGRVLYGESGERFKEFNSRDIVAIRSFTDAGYKVEIRTQSTWPGLRFMADRCGASVLHTKAIPDTDYIFVGDDIPDMNLIKNAVTAYCPADANTAIRKICKVLPAKSGEGVISELLNEIIPCKP